MSAPEVEGRPGGRTRLTRLIGLVPLLVLLVVLAVVLAGRGVSEPDGVANPASGHGAHTAPATAGASDEATADAADAGRGPDAPADTAVEADDTGAAGAVDVAVAPPGSVPVPDPVTPADGHALDAPTGTTLTQAAGAPTVPVRVGAEALGEPREAIDPADLVTSDTALGGCHPAYGDAGQCLPLVPPSMSAHAADMLANGVPLDSMPHPWTCTELLRSFPDGVAVRQVPAPGVADPFGLDVDGDGTACAIS